MIPLFTAGLAPIDAGPTGVAECAPCHPAVTEAWAGSAHARSRTNAAFATAYAEARDPWCLNCHLPLQAQRGPGPTVAAAEGVTCAACHVRDGLVLVASPASSGAASVHAVREVPGFAEQVCAGCHEFPFPRHDRGSGLQYGLAPLQSTVSEWRSVPGAPGCPACHDHAAPGGADPAFVSAWLTVDAVATARGVRASLSAPGVPHAVPTGDPFRRLRLVTALDPGCDTVVASATLGRTIVDGGASFAIGASTVLPPAGARVVDLPGAASFWCLTAERVDPEHVGRVPPQVASVRLGSGPVR